MPIVVRIPYGGGIGAVEHHSESPEAYFAHTPGLRVVSPSHPVDAYWMLRQAVACEDPVIFFEPKRRYWDKAEVDESVEPTVPLFSRPGRAAGHGPHDRLLRPDGADLPRGRRRRRGRGSQPRGARPALAVTGRPRPGLRVRRAHRSAGRRARGAGVARPRRRDRRAGAGALLLLPRGAGAPGRRASTRPTRPRASRSTTCPTSTGCSTPSTGRWCTEWRPRCRTSGCPTSGEGLTEGEILTWYVAVGDTVVVNQTIVEVETAKAAVELPSPYAGRVAALHVAAGERRRRHARSSPSTPSPMRGDVGRRPSPRRGRPRTGNVAGVEESSRRRGRRTRRPWPSSSRPAPVPSARPCSSATASARPPCTGVRGGRPAAPRGRCSPPATAASRWAARSRRPSPAGRAPRAKPPVRKLAKDLGVDLAGVTATGPDGTVSRDDVLAAQRRTDVAPGPAATTRSSRARSRRSTPRRWSS